MAEALGRPAPGSADEKRLNEIEIILEACPWTRIEGRGVVLKTAAAQDAFLRELANESGRPIDHLVEAGYKESIPLYIQDGKTPRQVANAMKSAERHGMRG